MNVLVESSSSSRLTYLPVPHLRSNCLGLLLALPATPISQTWWGGGSVAQFVPPLACKPVHFVSTFISPLSKRLSRYMMYLLINLFVCINDAFSVTRLYADMWV
jgi:hypothetical protein